MKKAFSFILLSCVFFMNSSSFAQKKWKKFSYEEFGHSFELPSNFNESAIVAGGTIIYYVDTNLADVSIFVEFATYESSTDSLILQHKEAFNFISREFIQKDNFILMGEESSFGRFYMYEKCVFKDGDFCALRIYYPEKNKRYMETLIPKIGASLK